MRALLLGFRQFADFSGRTPRKDFWQFVSITQLILVALLLPAWFVFLEFFNELLVNSRVLDILCSTPITPDVVYHDLAAEVAYVWSYFAEDFSTTYRTTFICTIIAVAWGIIIALPTLAITARRLKDAGHSRWWICPFILLCIPLPIIADIAFICSIVTLVFCCQASKDDAAELLPPTPPAE